MGTGFLEQPQMQGAEVNLAWYFHSQIPAGDESAADRALTPDHSQKTPLGAARSQHVLKHPRDGTFLL